MSRPSIRPVVWDPPRATERASRRHGDEPFPPARLIPLAAMGPEDVAVDAGGRVLCGVADGRILRVDPLSGETVTVGNTGGRPLGLEVLPDGGVLVCDEERGLLRLDPTSGALTTVAGDLHGRPWRFCSNAAAATDGTIYVTESSRRFGLADYRADLLEHSGTGALYRRGPDGTIDVLLDGLHFANGVVLTTDQSAVIVAETGAYQLSRVEVSGPHAGRRTVICANLPGFPDNLARGSDGLIWVAMAAPRNPLLDRISRLHPLLRRLVWATPERLQPAAGRTVWAIAVDDAGTIVRDLQTQRDDFRFVTGVVEAAGRLYMASLLEPGILEVDLRAGG